MDNFVLKMKCISKSFPGVQALKDVSFDLKYGEIHAIVGENGAGKSTLIKVLGGSHIMDNGSIERDGVNVNISNPKDAIELGIGIVHQELNLVPAMTATQNVFLNKEIKRSFGLDTKKMNSITQGILSELSEKYIPTTRYIRDMSIAQQQMVEIAKAINRNAKILVFDEPTSILGTEETKVLFSIMRKMKEQGISIVYISHRLDEIFELCDRVTVLRDGMHINTFNLQSEEITRNDLIKAMVGREIGHLYATKNSECDYAEDFVLKVCDLCRRGEYSSISFGLKKGEILGFAGLIGAGRTEIMRTIFGLNRADSGYLELYGNKVDFIGSSQAISMGIGYVTEDRKRDGLFLDKTVLFNMTISTLDKFSSHGYINRTKQYNEAFNFVNKLSIKPPLLAHQVKKFSGGNQQKVALSKVLMNDPKILILDEPTRGVDVGAKQEIYNIINEIASQGISILLVSSEMDEVLGISDRVIVMHEGEIMGELLPNETNPEEVLRLASGFRAKIQ